jgi:hypothetical protein
MKRLLALFFTALLFSTSVFAGSADRPTYDEFIFLDTFKGKNAEFVLKTIGEPDLIEKKENAGGTVEFWLYENLVRQGSSDKLYRFTQIGIVNDAIETLGHTNLSPK